MTEDTAEITSSVLYSWLVQGVQTESSDLHLLVGHAPVFRVYGKLIPIAGEMELSSEDIERILEGILNPDRRKRLVAEKNVDFAIELPVEEALCRFRVNVFLSDGKWNACIRIIPSRIPDFAWTTFPEEVAHRIASYHHGLVLFTGVTGSGKSTSLALIIELLNQRGGYRIITIEDPVEYRFPIYPHSLISQREVGRDVDSFADGLKYGLRQDPDIIFVGEIRDAKTARMALSAAETGHLVLSTLHTRDAKGAISRYADIFPQQVQSEVRAQLATVLRQVVCQKLLPSCIEGEKPELALEIMVNTPAIGSAIRMAKLESIDNYILSGRTEGMISMDESIRQLYRRGNISLATAESYITDRAFLAR